jgi:hypothetical protein
LVQTWNALTWAFAETGSGHIGFEDAWLKATEYAGRVDLPAQIRSERTDLP